MHLDDEDCPECDGSGWLAPANGDPAYATYCYNPAHGGDPSEAQSLTTLTYASDQKCKAESF